MPALTVRCAYFGCGKLADTLDERGLCPACGARPACIRCGMPNAVAGRSAICPACKHEEHDPKHAERQARRALMAELGMPENAIWRQIVYPGAWAGKQWTSYSVTMFGMCVAEMPDPCPWPYWRESVSGGTGSIIVQLWHQRVHWSDCSAFVEGRWHPERGETVRMIGLEHVGKIGDAEQALRGLRLLRALDGRGRPSKLMPTTQEEAKKEQQKVKKAIKRKLQAGEAYNRSDIELFLYGVEQGGKFLAQKIAPVKYSTLEQAVLSANLDLARVKRKNVT